MPNLKKVTFGYKMTAVHYGGYDSSITAMVARNPDGMLFGEGASFNLVNTQRTAITGSFYLCNTNNCQDISSCLNPHVTNARHGRPCADVRGQLTYPSPLRNVLTTMSSSDYCVFRTEECHYGGV